MSEYSIGAFLDIGGVVGFIFNSVFLEFLLVPSYYLERL